MLVFREGLALSQNCRVGCGHGRVIYSEGRLDTSTLDSYTPSLAPGRRACSVAQESLGEVNAES